MAETITIPTPSLYLNSQDSSPTQTSPVKKGGKRPPPTPKDAPKSSESSGVTKRKQSKSRNGCITCKAKRLKCDETKPTCQQCARRNVNCGGYKKDFKWRPFEEMNFSGKPPGKSRKVSPPLPTSAPVHVKSESPTDFDEPQRPIHHSAPLLNVSFPPTQSPGMVTHGLPLPPSFHTSPYPPAPGMYSMPQMSPFMMAPPQISPMEQFAPGSVDSTSTMFEADSIDTRQTGTTAPSSVASGQSPRLVDLLLPGTDLSVPPEEYMEFRSQYPESLYLPSGLTPPSDLHAGADLDTGMLDTDDIEEVPRDFVPDRSSWMIRIPSPTPSNSSSSSTDSNSFPMFTQPQFSVSSPEMLTRRFDRDTCGILSVKDGPTENPWRTLVWPLARDCPALYHAIASMTSFHQSKDVPALRIQGIDHMRTSVHALASSLQNMRVDAAISTTLVLAFSESWDSHISTGINHIKGAKCLINKAITQHEHTPLEHEEFSRMKFLCNAWMYMDVIARLTSADDDDNNDFDLVSDSIFRYDEADGELDPLMGCATTLFPIVGRVANLVRKVRKSNSNGPSIISQATQLKGQLERWQPPSRIENPEDITTDPTDVVGTAQAYRHATLLYLHQAVPEMPSLSSAELAKRVMCELATVDPSSRAVIVQIYPLMAAGCEAVDEDRAWVLDRWESMQSRMKLGIIEKCQEVTKEVWNRRDAYAAANSPPDDLLERADSCFSPAASLKRGFSCLSEDGGFELEGNAFSWLEEGEGKRRATGIGAFEGPPQPVRIKMERGNSGVRGRGAVGTELLRREFTVKGRLHWLGVMKDWQWEVLLG